MTFPMGDGDLTPKPPGFDTLVDENLAQNNAEVFFVRSFSVFFFGRREEERERKVN